jgi:hypothetical protein
MTRNNFTFIQMIAGADIFLDILDDKEQDKVSVYLSDKEFEGSTRLHYLRSGDPDGWEDGSGAWYELKAYQGIELHCPDMFPLEMWLCPVTQFVFGDYPPIIYFKKNE